MPLRPAVLRLALTDFRGYEAARLEVDQRPVVLTGANGAGKTNLLEAISFLAPGRGLRRAKLTEIDRRAPASRRSRAPGRSRRGSKPAPARSKSAPAATPPAPAASAASSGSMAPKPRARPSWRA